MSGPGGRIDDADWTPPPDASPALRAGLADLAAARFAAAAESLAAAAESASDPHAAYRLGVAQALAGNRAAAIATWKRTLRLDAAFAAALYDLAVAHAEGGDAAAAAIALSRLVALHPDHAAGRFNLGNLLFRLGRAAEAVDAYAPLIAAANPPRDVLLNTGRALRRLDRLDEADACYCRALLDDPDDHAAHWNRAHVLFLAGRWAEGFAAWEHRLALGLGPPLRPRLPDWRGGPPPPRLLVVAEQGLGDTIQCLRYVPLLAARGCAVTLALHPPLAALARTLLPEAAAIPLDMAETAEADAWAPLFSLPHRMGLPDPGAAPELAARAPFPAAAPAAGRRPRIGLARAGNPAHDNDRWRSLPVEETARIVAARPGAEWISLNPGADMPPGVAQPELADFLASARLAAGLDLVISVDTAAAHLAATLGVATWILLPAEPDWRWGRRGAATPWYASARLFRQADLGDWPPVAAAVGDALGALPPS
ncbi:tetratricopeptide repeat protein [Oleispirillum naphthae]|uniref:tetratricopeptide repeat protein n=1 Tax=Oleispirillum naphthae TaxID=2838853 RepID=UPI00308239E1